MGMRPAMLGVGGWCESVNSSCDFGDREGPLGSRTVRIWTEGAFVGATRYAALRDRGRDRNKVWHNKRGFGIGGRVMRCARAKKLRAKRKRRRHNPTRSSVCFRKRTFEPVESPTTRRRWEGCARLLRPPGPANSSQTPRSTAPLVLPSQRRAYIMSLHGSKLTARSPSAHTIHPRSPQPPHPSLLLLPPLSPTLPPSLHPRRPRCRCTRVDERVKMALSKEEGMEGRRKGRGRGCRIEALRG